MILRKKLNLHEPKRYLYFQGFFINKLFLNNIQVKQKTM